MYNKRKHIARIVLTVFVLLNVFLQQGFEVFARSYEPYKGKNQPVKVVEVKKETHVKGNSYTENSFNSKKTIDWSKTNWPKTKTEKEIIIKYGKVKENEKSFKLNNVKSKLKMKKLQKKKSYKKGFDIVEIDETDNIEEALDEIRNTSGVLYAQPNYKVELLSVDDEYFERQWGLLNEVQEVGETGKAEEAGKANKSGKSDKPGKADESRKAKNAGKTEKIGADINITDAWSISEGSDSVVVGIIDTALDINHTEIEHSIYKNANEIPGNGIDDDGNGYIDDVFGWDFIEDDNTVNGVDSDHATMIAGIIAAKKDKEGIAGIAPGIKLLPLKAFEGNSAYTSDILDSLEYAENMNVDILNCSWGSSIYNQALRDAMEESGMIFICAAGNDGLEEPVYPAGFALPNVISVAAAGKNGELAPFSNYGDSVDVAAPGVDIFSTKPGNSYGYGNGTSYSAAFVTGIAALLKSSREELTGKDIACTIKSNAGGLVDAAATLANIKKYQEEDNDFPTDSEYEEQDNDFSTESEYEEEDGDSPTVSEDVYGMLSVSEDVYGMFGTLSLPNLPGLEDFLVEQIHYGQNGVSPASGNFSRSYTDAKVSVPGLDFVISRTYNSRDQKDCLHLGKGWRFGYEGFVKTGGNRTTVVLPDGSRHTFIRYNSNTYISDLAGGTRSRLVYDGAYKLTTKDQTVYEFGNSNNRLSSITDRYGNRIAINVNKKEKVQNITIQNTKGQAIRTFEVAYGTNELIESVTETTDANNKRVLVRYGYDNYKKLTTVTDSMNNTLYTYEYTGNLISSVKDAYLKTLEEVVYTHCKENSTYKVETHKVYSTDTVYNTYRYDYDPINRITAITDSSGRTVTKWFDRSLFTIKSKDPEGKETIAEYYTYEGKMDFSSFEKKGHAKTGMAEVVYNDRMYFFGGVIEITNAMLVYSMSTDQCEYFDTETNTWKTIRSMPKSPEQKNSNEKGRQYAAAAVLNSNIYVAGGESNHGNKEIERKLTSVLKYNPSKDSWTKVASLNNARYGHSLVELKGYLYAIGGIGAERSVEKYDPDKDKWTLF